MADEIIGDSSQQQNKQQQQQQSHPCTEPQQQEPQQQTQTQQQQQEANSNNNNNMCAALNAESTCENDAVGISSQSEKRGVRFIEDDTLCSYHSGAVLDVDLVESSRKDIWFQHADLAQIKRKAMVVSREAHRYGFGSLLTNTYGNFGDETQVALNTWCRNANSRRGLERWINDEYSAKRSDLRKRTIQSVLRAQQKMRQENINDPDYCWKVLARLSEAFSQDSQDFARAMGTADQIAAVLVAQASAEGADDNESKKSHGSHSSRRGPERIRSPTSVVGLRNPHRKNLGLSGTTTDFRHYY